MRESHLEIYLRKSASPAVDEVDMGNVISSLSQLVQGLALQNPSIEASLAVLKKTNDIAKQEGSAVVAMLEDLLPQTNEHTINIYA